MREIKFPEFDYFEEIKKLRLRLFDLESVLRLIAAPPRPDGTYNRCREACQKLAEEALKDETI